MWKVNKLINSISEKGEKAKTNEDLSDSIGDLLFVMDGATPLGDRRYFPGDSDAKWLVQAISLALKNVAGKREDIPLKTMLKEALEIVNNKVKEKGIDFSEMKPYEQPSCAIGLARFNREQLEYLVLGDCTIACGEAEPNKLNKYNLIDVISDKRGDWMDNQDLNQLKEFINQGKSFKEARQLIDPSVREHRAMMNTPKGRWILTLNGEGLEHAIEGKIEIPSKGKVLLCTDGFSAAIDKYGINTWEQAFSRNSKEIINELREKQNQGPEKTGIPEFKLGGDDSTCLTVQYERERMLTRTANPNKQERGSIECNVR